MFLYFQNSKTEIMFGDKRSILKRKINMFIKFLALLI
jgi:hypothetical protein